MNSKVIIVLVVFVFILLIGFLMSPQEEIKKAEDGDTVSVLYTGKFENGTVFDSSEMHNNTPYIFELGSGSSIEGFNDAVIGMEVGEIKTVAIPPEKAYGSSGSGHPLSGKTLIFEIKLIEIS